MKTINPNTKVAQHYIFAYRQNSVTELRQAYGRYSTTKQFIENACRNTMVLEQGYDFRIITWNTFQFTCGWRIGRNLRVETKDNSYIIKKAF